MAGRGLRADLQLLREHYGHYGPRRELHARTWTGLRHWALVPALALFLLPAALKWLVMGNLVVLDILFFAGSALLVYGGAFAWQCVKVPAERSALVVAERDQLKPLLEVESARPRAQLESEVVAAQDLMERVSRQRELAKLVEMHLAQPWSSPTADPQGVLRGAKGVVEHTRAAAREQGFEEAFERAGEWDAVDVDPAQVTPAELNERVGRIREALVRFRLVVLSREP